MAVIQDIIAALWQHDFAALADPHIVSVVYFVMFATLFLENGLLPASFLPGDSLLILAGALIAQGVMDFLPTIAILTAAASLGCWLSYIQGRWLGNTKTVKGWLAQLPAKYSCICPYVAANHGGNFRSAKPPLPVFQLVKWIAVGQRGNQFRLCLKYDSVR